MIDPDSPDPGRLFVLTGAPSAGTTSTGRALAEGLSRAAFIDGAAVGDTVVSGREPMTATATVPAVEQLFLRYAGSLALADVYRSAGFDAVIADTVVGSYLEDFLEIASPDPVHLVVLHPSLDSLYDRADQDAASGYAEGIAVEDLWHAVDQHTARVGLWLDTTGLTVAQTITRILHQLDTALVDTTNRPAPSAD